MQISIKCDCGNEITIPAPVGKHTQFRDWLETKQFHFGKTEIKNAELHHRWWSRIFAQKF